MALRTAPAHDHVSETDPKMIKQFMPFEVVCVA